MRLSFVYNELSVRLHHSVTLLSSSQHPLVKLATSPSTSLIAIASAFYRCNTATAAAASATTAAAVGMAQDGEPSDGTAGLLGVARSLRTCVTSSPRNVCSRLVVIRTEVRTGNPASHVVTCDNRSFLRSISCQSGAPLADRAVAVIHGHQALCKLRHVPLRPPLSHVPANVQEVADVVVVCGIATTRDEASHSSMSGCGAGGVLAGDMWGNADDWGLLLWSMAQGIGQPDDPAHRWSSDRTRGQWARLPAAP